MSPARTRLIAAAGLAAAAAGPGALAAGVAYAWAAGGSAGALAGLAGGLAAAAGLGGGATAQLQRRARRSEAERSLFRHVLEAAPAGRLIVDERARASYQNAAAASLLAGTGSAEPLAGLRTRLAISDAGSEAFEEMLSTARQGQTAQADLPVRGSHGGLAWWQIMAEPLHDRDGHILIRIEDVTAQRHDAEAAQREQARLHDFLDHAPVGFFSLDADGQFILVNSTMARWLGTTPEQLTQAPARLHDYLLERPNRAQPYDIVARAGPDQRGEVTLAGREGASFPAFIHQRVVRDEWGRLRTRAVVRDLTPEHEWAAALRSSEQRFRRLFDTAPIGIALLRSDLAVAECNRALAQLTPGATQPGDVAEESFVDLVAEADRATLAERLAAVRDGGDWRGPPLEARLNDDRGGVVAVIAGREAGPTQDTGSDASLIVHVLDMTEQRELEERFAQSQKMEAVGQLAGGVAHDFNNLLTAMAGFCDLLLQRHKPGDQSFEEVMQIKQNCNRAANLVRQLLAFSRQQQLQPAVVSITDILGDLAHLLRRLLGETIELSITHGRELGPVKVDPGQLEQVIINLCVNARDAILDTPEGGGKLTIVTSNVQLARAYRHGTETIPPGDYVLIEVIDTGTGMAPEHRERVFEPFFSTKSPGAGTGLGLSTVYGIVRQTGGYIILDSAEGEGTRVAIYLPQHAGEHVAPASTPEPPAADLTGSGTLLIVEDEDAVRTFATTALRKKGYRVFEAAGGEQALALLGETDEAIDLLITDVVMPDLDGPTLVARVRAQQPDMRAIFISGYTADQVAAQTADIGNATFLAKPFSLRDLASTVKDMLASAPAARPAAE